MSREYAEKRIKEALKKFNGNAVKARQQVIAWSIEDPKLLQALTRSHLTGIVAYNIERILSGRSAAVEAAEHIVDSSKPAASSQSGKPQKKENFGMEILKAVAVNGGGMFGMEAYSGGSHKRQKVSKGHIDAIKAMTQSRKISE